MRRRLHFYKIFERHFRHSMKRFFCKKLLLILLGICMLLLGACAVTKDANMQASELIDTPYCLDLLNPYSTLSVPTYVTKIDDLYFIVDCYHNQVLYHDNLEDPLTEWQVLTDEVYYAHTVASDGVVYLIDDTENNRILIYEKEDGLFYLTQLFTDIGVRPHYIVYDADTALFYAWSSMTGEMYLFSRDESDNRIYLKEIRSIAALNGVYVRSFTILGDSIYFVSGNSAIIEADLATFEIINTYAVPDTMAGMIQLTKIQSYYYITVSTDADGDQNYATILRTEDLDGLIDGEYEDVYDAFISGGTPYYISTFDGHYYMTEHRINGVSIWQFDVVEDEITDTKILY